MGCENNLAAYKRNSQIKTNKSIAERINRCVMIEIGESVRIFGKILQRENLGLIAAWCKLIFNA